MTDTRPLLPTDDEIDAVVQACRERGLREFDVFRTVVAKFGTPALVWLEPAREPLSESEYKRGYQDGYERRDAEVRGALV